MKTDHLPSRSLLRILLATAFVLALPLVAMKFTEEVAWSLADFVVAAVLLTGTGLAYELLARKSGGIAYRAAVGLALAAALLLVWTNLAVGIIGEPDNPANLMYLGVLAVGFIGALLARFRPPGMAHALIATALAQAVIAVVALLAGLGVPASEPLRFLIGNGVFVAMFAGAAWLFRQAARDRSAAG